MVDTSEASPDDFEYDVCLTFAGEQREYVEEVARELKQRQIRVFFDDFERDQMLVLEWKAMIAAPSLADASDLELAVKMLHLAREPYCQFHANEALMELNFTGLSTATFDPDGH